MNDPKLAILAKSQKSCSSCTTGCPTSGAVRALPPNVQAKFNALVQLVNDFNELCRANGSAVRNNELINISDAHVSSFGRILDAYSSLVRSEGWRSPTFAEDSNRTLVLHGNEVFHVFLALSQQ